MTLRLLDKKYQKKPQENNLRLLNKSTKKPRGATGSWEPRAELRALPADYEMRPQTKEEKQRDFDYMVGKTADKIFTHATGLTPEEGRKGKENLENVIGRAPLAAMSLVSPLYALGFEALNQAKNVTVSKAKGKKYSPLERSLLSELIPEDVHPAVKIGSSVAENLADIALMAGAINLAKKGLLTKSIKNLGNKLTKAGYGKNQKAVRMEDIRKAAKGSTIEKEAARWLKTKRIKIPAKGPKIAPPKAGGVPKGGVKPVSPKISPPKAGKAPARVSPAEQPLIQEAKKYKSADEFIKAQGTPDVKMIKISDLPDRATAIGMPKEQFDEMAKLIKEKGIENPIIINEYGDVIDGMHRAFVASELGLKEIPAIKVKNMSLEDARKLSNNFSKTKSQLTDIWNKAQEDIGTPIQESPKPLKLLDYQYQSGAGEGFIMFEGTPAKKVPKGEKGSILRTTPPEKKLVDEEFLRQPKKKTNIVQYFTPAEYHLKQLGFDKKIGQPIRESLQDFSIELMQKNEFIQNTQKFQQKALVERNKKVSAPGKFKANLKQSNEKIWQMMDRGIPASSQSTEAKVARRYRKETKAMLDRMNEIRQKIGEPKIKGVKNYILHMLKPEILNEIYSRGVIPPELAKVMDYIPTKKMFLRTAQKRQGVPEEWLVKDPHQLMKTMYAIDLRYVHLQNALHEVDPYLKAVKSYVGPEGEYWSPETYKYLDDWVKQAIKMRPSNWDTLVDNLMEHTLAPVLRKSGVKVSNMPWRDFVNTLSAGAHTGALGLRIKPVLRNLVQSTFDWVMYGTKPYLKASQKFMTREGFDVLKKSKIWKTRMPYEAQDLATIKKIFKVGGIGYRMADLHNVGKGILTRYYHATDDLGMTPKDAIKWADQDLPATQWSYRREDLPRAYWTTTGRAFWTLGSWWMNFYSRFLPEILRRTFKGVDVMGRQIPTSERLAGMRLLILAGTLFALRQGSKELTGTVVDYTGQIKPTPMRMSPIASMGNAFINISQGITDKNNRKLQKGLRELSYTGKIFIPFWLAADDLLEYLTGEKSLQEILFYGRQEKSTQSPTLGGGRKKSAVIGGSKSDLPLLKRSK